MLLSKHKQQIREYGIRPGANLHFCLVQMAKRKDPSSVDIKGILLDMRKYRMGLIQTPDQLRFSYMAVLEGSKSIMGDSSVQVPEHTMTKSIRQYIKYLFFYIFSLSVNSAARCVLISIPFFFV